MRDGAAPPTRLGLLRARRRLERVAKGIALLRRKRDALVRAFFGAARPAAEARGRIAAQAARAYALLLESVAEHGAPDLRSMARPAARVQVEVRPGQVWGLSISEIQERPVLLRTPAARGTAPGATGPAAAGTAGGFERLAGLLLEAAPKELLLRRLGEALARTTRQVNTLDREVTPRLRERIAAIRATLDEREREEHVRLRHLIRRRRPAGRSPAGVPVPREETAWHAGCSSGIAEESPR